MNQTIVDIPAHNGHSKYNLQQLNDLPVDKAIRMELDDKTQVSTARGVVWNFCKKHNLKAQTHTAQEKGIHVLYVWLPV